MLVNEPLPTLPKLPSVGASAKLCKTGPSLPPGDWLGSRRRSCGRRRRRLEKESFPIALPLIFRFSARNADLSFKPRRSEAELRLGFSIRRLPSMSAVSLLSRNSSDEQPVDDDLEHRPNGRGGQVALVDHACDSADEPGELEGVDAGTQIVSELLDDLGVGSAEGLTLGPHRRGLVLHGQRDLGRAALVYRDQLDVLLEPAQQKFAMCRLRRAPCRRRR